MLLRDIGSAEPRTASTAPASNPPSSYRVEHNDTLESIAGRFGVTRDAIVQANPALAHSPSVMPGDVLAIPAKAPAVPASAPATPLTPQQRTDQAVADYKKSPGAQAELDQAVGTEVAERLKEPATSPLTPQQRKQLGEPLPTDAERAVAIRKEIVARYQQDPAVAPAVQAAADRQEADSLLTAISSGAGEPNSRLLALDTVLKGASSDQVRALARQNPLYDRIVQGAADWAAAPYKGDPITNSNQVRPEGEHAKESSGRYVDLLKGLSSPDLRARLIGDARPQLDKLMKFNDIYGNICPFQTQSSILSDLSSVVGTLREQDPAAAMGLASELAGQIRNPSAIGMNSQLLLTDATRWSGDPTLALAITERVKGNGSDRINADWADQTRAEIFKTVGDSHYMVDSDMGSYVELAGELNSLVAKEGASMTQDQLNQAIAAYKQKKGPEWEQKVDAALDRLADDGKRLLTQQAALGDWLAGHPGDADAVKGALNKLTGGDNAQAAIRLAVQKDPTVLQGKQGESLLSLYAMEGKALDQGARKLVQELGENYVKGRLDTLRAGLKANDTDSLRRTCDELTRLGDDKRLSTVLAVSGDKQVDLKAATEALKENVSKSYALSELPKDPQAVIADTQKNLKDLDGKLNGMKAFDKGSVLGASFRLFSVGAAGLGTYAALEKAAAPGQSVEEQWRNSLSVLVGAAGFGQKSAGLLSHIGVAESGSAVDTFGKRIVDRWLNGLSGAIDLWKAGDAFGKGDNTEGALYATTGAGSLMWAFGTGSWAGPVGIALVALGTVGLIAYQDKKANDKAQPGREAFLQGLGYNEGAAKALGAWHSKGDGAASSLLLRYGELRHMSAAQTIQWFNGLDKETQKNFGGALTTALDSVDGHAEKFGNTADNDHAFDQDAAHHNLFAGSVDHGLFGTGPGILLRTPGVAIAGEMPLSSAHQLDVVLKDVLGVNPPGTP